MPSRKYWPVCVVVLSLSWGLGPREANAQAGRIRGKVVDVESGDAIRGASISAESPQGSLTSMSVISDDKGRFAMIGLRSGEWIVSASAPGYEPLGGLVPIRASGNNQPLEFKLTKRPALSVSPLAAIDSGAFSKDLQLAHTLLEQGKFDESISAYQALLNRLPLLTTARLQVARAYRQKKDFDSAMREYAAISNTDSRTGLVQIEIGLTEMERGDLAAADRVLSAAAGVEGASPETFYSLAEIKRARTMPAEAATWYKRATDTDPGWSSPYVKLGLIAFNQGDFASATQYLERAVKLEPEGPDATEARSLLEKARR